jgi:putative membrane protein
MRYYILRAVATGPGLPAVLALLYFRYHTLRYRFDHQGVSMRWGVLFRHEIALNYSRIQDVHLKSNAVERWLGLARIEVQTASGGPAAEMTIEGLLDYDAVRDYLYSRMRGAKDEQPSRAGPALDPSTQTLAGTLHRIAEELRAIRRLLEERRRV